MLEKNGVPYNLRFDDVYFDANDPVAERNSVYVSAIDELLENSPKDEIIIAETGFGFGLSFFCSVKKALERGVRLHYLACEIQPILLQDLSEFYSKYTEFSAIFADFELSYEIVKNEVVRLHLFNSQIILDIFFGDAFLWLDECDFRADIWYIDGFSPSKNSEIFSADLLAKISAHCQKNAILRSYSCARIFKDSLNELNFSFSKRVGQGKKREFMHAICTEPKVAKSAFNPWFIRCAENIKYKSVLIVGAGISGLITAFELKKLGISVKIIEKLPSLKNGASSNLAGLCLPLINKPCSKLGKAHICAFLSAFEFYKKHLEFAPFVSFCGVTYIANDGQIERFKSASDEYKGILELNENEIFIKKAMQIAPLKLREYLSKEFEIHFDTEFSGLNEHENGYEILAKNGDRFYADAVIFACGASGNELIRAFDENILLSAVRGQTTYLSPFCVNHSLPLSARGYICAPNDDIMVVGSSFDRDDLSLELRTGDDEENIAKIAEFSDFSALKKPEILGANAGLRAYCSDRFMLCSQMHDFAAYCADYKGLLWKKTKAYNLPLPRYKKGIFASVAHGAHGLCSSVLAAQIIADLITNRPLCVSHSLFSEFHSARFLIRKLKKGILK